MRIRDGKNVDPGCKKFGSGINIPDVKHWKTEYWNCEWALWYLVPDLAELGPVVWMFNGGLWGGGGGRAHRRVRTASLLWTWNNVVSAEKAGSFIHFWIISVPDPRHFGTDPDQTPAPEQLKFFADYFLKLQLHHFSKIKSQNKVTKQ
jgi:hypothetical protein